MMRTAPLSPDQGLPVPRPGWRWAGLAALTALGLSVATTAGAQAEGGAMAPFAALPFPARIAMLVENGEVAGRAVTIAAFETGLEPAAMLARLRAQWSGDPRRPWLQTRSGDWQIVSRQTPAGTVTLQYRDRDGSGTGGLISFWPRVPARAGASPAGQDRLDELVSVLPADSRVARTASRDGARRTQTLMARSDADPDVAWARLVAGLGEQGYVQRRGPGARSVLAHTRSGVFLQRDRELIVTLDARGADLGIVMQLVGAAP